LGGKLFIKTESQDCVNQVLRWLETQISVSRTPRLVLLFLAHQHKATGVKIRLSKNNDHEGPHTASNVARKATAFSL